MIHYKCPLDDIRPLDDSVLWMIHYKRPLDDTRPLDDSVLWMIHYKRPLDDCLYVSHRWVTFMPTRSSFRRPAGVCPWPFSVLFIHNVNK